MSLIAPKRRGRGCLGVGGGGAHEGSTKVSPEAEGAGGKLGQDPFILVSMARRGRVNKFRIG